VPLPVPELPAEMWRKVEVVEAVQLHPEPVLTAMEFDVVAATTFALEGLNE
jgi:hypothetical protein